MKNPNASVRELDAVLLSKGYIRTAEKGSGDFIASNASCSVCKRKMDICRAYQHKQDSSKIRQIFIICRHCGAIKVMSPNVAGGIMDSLIDVVLDEHFKLEESVTIVNRFHLDRNNFIGSPIKEEQPTRKELKKSK